MAKKKPTKADREHYDKVVELGCVICEMPAEIHHLTGIKYRGKGQKADNDCVIPLCFFHHRAGNKGEAVHSGVKSWEKNFGTQEELLEKVRECLSSSEYG